jgi:hypothetical protein
MYSIVAEGIPFIALAALAACITMAWRWGGRDERLTALAFTIATIASGFSNQNHYGHVEFGVLAIDFLLLAGLLLLALKSDRFWPIWATAFQLVGTSVHIASMTETGEFAWAYAVGLIFWSYAVMASLMAGTWLEARFRTR